MGILISLLLNIEPYSFYFGIKLRLLLKTNLWTILITNLGRWLVFVAFLNAHYKCLKNPYKRGKLPLKL